VGSNPIARSKTRKKISKMEPFRGSKSISAAGIAGEPQRKEKQMNTMLPMLFGAVVSFAATLTAIPIAAADDPQKAIVLVHGGFVDGSGWEGVYQILRKDGYEVSVVQNPTVSLAGDVAATKAVIDAQDKPVILVGHSYGGVVVTEAGNDPKVAGLVYIAAFAPDAGESVATLIANPAPGAPVPPILPPQNGFLFLDKTKFPEAFAADVDAEKAAFMADAQTPWGVEALNGKISKPAWKGKQSWYLVASEDKMIPPDAQRAMSKRAGSVVVEEKGSHAIYVSRPEVVARLIETAAENVAQK
jgi:pimeloyl-ACP methyl ester carboxylesterase